MTRLGVLGSFKACPSPWLSVKSLDFANYEQEVCRALPSHPLTPTPPLFPPAMSAAGSPQLAPPPDNNPPKDRSILLAVRARGVSAGVVGLCGIVYSVYFFLSLISVVNGANFVFRVPRFLHTKPCGCTCFLSAWMCVYLSFWVNFYFITIYVYACIAPLVIRFTANNGVTLFWKTLPLIPYRKSAHILFANSEIAIPLRQIIRVRPTLHPASNVPQQFPAL